MQIEWLCTGFFKALCSKIKIPPVMPKRGRPKGADLTLIGIPRKRKERVMSGKDTPIPFKKKQACENDKGMRKSEAVQ